MADVIETANLKVDPELCKRIDAAVYSQRGAPAHVVNKAAVIRAELVALLATYDAALAESQKDCTLFRLCTWVERLQIDWAKRVNERGHANMQTAHNQLANWK